MELHAGCKIGTARNGRSTLLPRAAKLAVQQMAGKDWESLPRTARAKAAKLLLVKPDLD